MQKCAHAKKALDKQMRKWYNKENYKGDFKSMFTIGFAALNMESRAIALLLGRQYSAKSRACVR